jgi:hypothetical protein
MNPCVMSCMMEPEGQEDWVSQGGGNITNSTVLMSSAWLGIARAGWSEGLDCPRGVVTVCWTENTI